MNMATPIIPITELDLHLRKACIESNPKFTIGYGGRMSDEDWRVQLYMDSIESVDSVENYIAQFVERGERPDKETFWKAVKTRDITIIKLFVEAFHWESEIMDDVLVRSCQRDYYAPMEVIEFLVANGANILAKNAGVLDALIVEGAPIEMVRKVMAMGGGYISDFTLDRFEYDFRNEYMKTVVSFGVKLKKRAMQKYMSGQFLASPMFRGKISDIMPDHLIRDVPKPKCSSPSCNT